jgi:alkylation response protein AidB-like acyl-CoA dehydrogenase
MVRTGAEGPKGISALVIEKDMPGVSFGAAEKKLGWHSQPTAQVNFDEVRVPVENLVGGEGEGFRIAMMGLDGGRLNIGACSLGGAQRCLDESVAYVKERKAFGQSIADFQNTQFTLADMETELQSARMLLYAAAVKVTEMRRTGRALRRWRRGLRPTSAARRRSGAAASWRLRLSAGLSDRALLARSSSPLDPRGDQPDHAGRDLTGHASPVNAILTPVPRRRPGPASRAWTPACAGELE